MNTASTSFRFWARRLAPTPAHRFALAVALVAAAFFFLPTLASLREAEASKWPSFMLTGDVRMAWFPQFVQGYHRFWKGGIFGTDFLTHGGAGSFGFRANMLPIYPPYLLSYLVFDIRNVRKAGMVFAGLHFLHVFVGTYFCVRLGQRFLKLSAGGCVLFACLYTLSYQTSMYLAFTPWFFQILLLPVLAYTLSLLIFRGNLISAILSSSVFVVYMLTNYAPTMFLGLIIAISTALFVFHRHFGLENWRSVRRNALLMPMAALIISLLVVSPYYAAQFHYFGFSVAAGVPKSLKMIAHDDAFSPTSFITGLSQYIRGAPAVEGRFYWGLIPFLTLAAGLALAAVSPAIKTIQARAVFSFALPAYLVAALVTLGAGSILSDAFYYGVPVLGSMHIYQRYLMFMQFLLALAVATSADMFVFNAGTRARAVMLATGLIGWLAASMAIIGFADASKFVVVEGILPEIFLAMVAAATLAIGRSTIAVAGIALLLLPSNLVPTFNIQREYGSKAIWRQYMDYEPATLQLLASRLHVDGKLLPKVLNVTDSIDSFLPHNQSWLLPGGLRFMNFTGYEPHLAMDRAYFNMMGGWYGRFNREWVLRTGVDFVVWDEASRWKLEQLIVDTVTAGPPVSLKPGLFLTKLSYREPGRIGQDTALLSYLEAHPGGWNASVLDGWKIENGRFVKVPGTQNHIGIMLKQRPGAIYDVSLDVVASTRGSVMVAFGGLGSASINGAQPGRHTRRFTVDGSGDLWITGTPDFDGALTNLVVREVSDQLPARLEPVFDNGVVRVEGISGKVDVRRASTDFSQRVRVDLSTAGPSRVAYMLWANPYMMPYLDGNPVKWTQIGNWPAFVEIPPGEHRFEVRFKSGLTRASLIAFALWALLFFAAIGYSIWQPARRLGRA